MICRVCGFVFKKILGGFGFGKTVSIVEANTFFFKNANRAQLVFSAQIWLFLILHRLYLPLFGPGFCVFLFFSFLPEGIFCEAGLWNWPGNLKTQDPTASLVP